jgi:hypothetical protein
MEVVNSRYQLPPSPTIPDQLIIRYGFRRTATMDDSGIRLTINGKLQTYKWDDVCEARIRRMDAKRRDFSQLILVLPDDEVKLRVAAHEGGYSPTWRGASAEEVSEFLLRHVPSQKLILTFSGETPSTLKECDRAIREVRTRQKFTGRLIACYLAFIITFVIWFAVSHGIVGALTLCAMYLVFPGSVILYIHLANRKRAFAM